MIAIGTPSPRAEHRARKTVFIEVRGRKSARGTRSARARARRPTPTCLTTSRDVGGIPSGRSFRSERALLRDDHAEPWGGVQGGQNPTRGGGRPPRGGGWACQKLSPPSSSSGAGAKARRRFTQRGEGGTAGGGCRRVRAERRASASKRGGEPRRRRSAFAFSDLKC